MVPGLPRAAELAGALGARRPAMHQFEFCPSAPTATSSPSERKPLPATAISREHVKLQRALYDRLVETHGPNSVAVEMMVPCGRPADIVVSVGDRFEVYEIKVAACAKDCIRQALGQLIEYAYWPGSPGVACIVVAGPAPLDPETDEYLNLLRLDFAIPIRYERIVT